MAKPINIDAEAINDVADDMLELIHRFDGIGGSWGELAHSRNKLTKDIQKILDKTIEAWREEMLEKY